MPVVTSRDKAAIPRFLAKHPEVVDAIKAWAAKGSRYAHIENADDAAKLLLHLTGSVAAAYAAIVRNRDFLTKPAVISQTEDHVRLQMALAIMDSDKCTFGEAARKAARMYEPKLTPEGEEALIKKLRRQKDKLR
jgi:hypothetical protein